MWYGTFFCVNSHRNLHVYAVDWISAFCYKLFLTVGRITMKLFKYLALLALASVPLLLIEKKKQKAAAVAAESDDDIFERELTTD